MGAASSCCGSQETAAETATAKPDPSDSKTSKAETFKAETPKHEIPKAETPKAETPKAETPKAETPNDEDKKFEVPNAEDSNATPLEAMTSEVEAKAPEIEASDVEASKVETPKPDFPKVDTPNEEKANIEIVPSHKLIRTDDVKIALKKDKGSNAVLKSFEIKDFTSKGDNYASLVTSIEVKYDSDGVQRSVTYVVKVNPCRSELMEGISKITFEKEIGFYTQVLPLINSELVRVGYSKIKAAQCYHYVETPKEQVIFLEDLRGYGYKMADRQKGIDFEHVVLILKEMAALHAASQLLFARGKYRGCDHTLFPGLREIMTAKETGLENWGG